MSVEEFYDRDWKLLKRKYPLVARKLECVRCDCVAYVEFEDLLQRVSVLERVLDRTNKKKKEELE